MSRWASDFGAAGPLVWGHAELARALYVLDAAQRRASWGAAGLWVWTLPDPDMETYRGFRRRLNPDMSPCREAGGAGQW
jgi:hypothetical protein